MKPRQLARLCIHDRLDAHLIRWDRRSDNPNVIEAINCPGGVFLPDDTLIIEKVIVDRQALAEALEMLYEPDLDDQGRNTTPVRYPLDVIGTAAGLILDALSVREAE